MATLQSVSSWDDETDVLILGCGLSGVVTVISPPFYAVEIVPAIVANTGGAKRNSKSQVLDFKGQAIPRLYEVGELGSIVSNLYQNGSFLTECMVFGRIVGTEVIALDRWGE